MDGKQTVMQYIYPMLKGLGKLFGVNGKTLTENKKAVESFYNLSAVLNNGTAVDFGSLKNKKVLIVNTASDCGYTPQYKELQKLYELKTDVLEIIAFPANDFKEQEKADDAAIANFCETNYGVTFPLVKKAVVLKKENQHAVYKWLTDETKNGWNLKAPTWNFCKYLIDENGNLTHFFEAALSPLDNTVLEAIDTKK
jgi:glutathione peroxidase